ncbi:hypothetical protein I4F81_008474 [Pyropia yezoensis]|uniref:Uncharacterized protein n=1 Tax=Pyropia yezoensis TaxID=2788 RepID=A0ACC3C865_PYRYE|nr:hypothetical protein I4F81_008474 [Neopyropia yezoensis]
MPTWRLATDVSLEDAGDDERHRVQRTVARRVPRPGEYCHHQEAKVARAPSWGRCRPQNGLAFTQKTLAQGAEPRKGGASVVGCAVAHLPCTDQRLSRSRQRLVGRGRPARDS